MVKKDDSKTKAKKTRKKSKTKHTAKDKAKDQMKEELEKITKEIENHEKREQAKRPEEMSVIDRMRAESLSGVSIHSRQTLISEEPSEKIIEEPVDEPDETDSQEDLETLELPSESKEKSENEPDDEPEIEAVLEEKSKPQELDVEKPKPENLLIAKPKPEEEDLPSVSKPSEIKSPEEQLPEVSVQEESQESKPNLLEQARVAKIRESPKPTEGMDPSLLTPIERSIYLDSGSKGVKLFRMADGLIGISEASDRLGLSMSETRDLLESLEGKFIFLEREKKKKEIVVVQKKEQSLEPIDVPKKVSKDSITRFTVGSQLAFKFGPAAKKIYDSINGKFDTTQLATENIVTLEFLDEIMWFLAEKKQLHFTRLGSEDIKNRYGAHGLAIYSESGRKGIFLYSLLERFADPLTAIRASGIDHAEALDIYEHISKVAGLPGQFNKKDMLSSLQR